MVENLEEISQSNDKPTACLIFLHGVSRSGEYEKKKFIKLLGDKVTFKHVKVVFPTAPLQRFGIFNKVTNCWFNTEEENGRMKTELSDIDRAVESIRDIIENQKEYGINPDRIIIGGVSQGGMLAMHTAYRFCNDLAGCIGVSACLPEQHAVYQGAKEAKKNPELLMLHSTNDSIVPIRWGQLAYERLNAVGVNGEFHEIPGASHEIIFEELEIIYKWIEKLLPEN